MMTDWKPATASEYMEPAQGPRDAVTRQTLALALMIVSPLCGALALYRLGVDSVTVRWAAGLVIGFGALAGWIHHPVRRFRVRGAMAGGVAAGGALLGEYLYLAWRGGDQKIWLVEELLIPLAIGAAPGLYMYYVLLREERVAPWEDPSGARPS
jgi:hypothetical protein